MINILLTFKKKVRFSIHFSLINVLRFQTEASCLLNYHCGQIAHYLHYLAKEDILRIINNLDPNKAHDHDESSIRMLKICGDSVCRPLNIIFKTCLRTVRFPWNGKKLILFQFIKKVISKLLKTTVLFDFYRFAVKYLKDCFIMKWLSFFLENELISPKQSGFRPGDSCINQLLSINHEILSAFDIGLEVRGLFLDVSKAFDKVWHASKRYMWRLD